MFNLLSQDIVNTILIVSEVFGSIAITTIATSFFIGIFMKSSWSTVMVFCLMLGMYLYKFDLPPAIYMAGVMVYIIVPYIIGFFLQKVYFLLKKDNPQNVREEITHFSVRGGGGILE